MLKSDDNTHCLLMLLMGVRIFCWAPVLICGSCCHFLLSNHNAEDETAGSFTLNVLWLSVFCVSSPWCRELVRSVIVGFPGHTH